MIERGDLKVFHEPFSYFYYVHKGDATIPQEYVDPEHPRTYPDIKQMILSAAEKGAVYFKDMAAHCFDHLVRDEAFIAQMHNTFLIRDPAKTIASYYALNPDVSEAEIGCEQLCRLFRRVTRIAQRTPVVVDADDLEDDPAGIVAAYCRHLNIPFIPESLQWKPEGSRKWKIWENWHRDAEQSTGIVKNLETFSVTIDNSKFLKEYYDHHLPYYREMYRHRIAPDAVSA
jgi:hypothetical protein